MTPPRPRSTIKDFKNLQRLKLEIETATRLAEEREAARRAATARAQAEQNMFTHAVGPV